MKIKCVYLADDDADDADLFKEAIREIAPETSCQVFHDGRELLKGLKTGDLAEMIFLDINMPVMNGWDCLREINKIPAYRSIPVIIYSTSSSKRDRTIARELGASYFYTKADSFSALKQFLNSVLIGEVVLNKQGLPAEPASAESGKRGVIH